MSIGQILKDQQRHRLYQLYYEYGLTQNVIADRLGITQAAVSQRLRTIERLCEKFGLTLDRPGRGRRVRCVGLHSYN